MHAIFKTGGKQYRVAPGDTVRVERLPHEAGTAVEFPQVLAVFGDDGAVLTQPELSSAKVVGTITDNDRAKKIVVFKFKRKKQYRRTIGHRQNYSEIKVDSIVV
ncbi:MAG: 50S ribosomal protein L21 [Bryobacterales bacterium]|jgi:large subunit ribosomal protein L21|nr:50S ribosomal protein L21 [Bryobacterales bacterium]